MGKSIASLYRYVEISRSITKRYLAAVPDIPMGKVLQKEVMAVSAPKEAGKRRYSGFSLLSEETVLVLETIASGDFILTNMMLDFSGRVRKANENRLSSDVERCKDYIARNRTKKFTLCDLAENVGKNPSYLSDKFSRQTGMTIQEYTKRQRLEAAANMLVYSDTGIGDIAEYLHFSSQSYFGVCFKKYYHMTPAEYRERHQVIDFNAKAERIDKNPK